MDKFAQHPVNLLANMLLHTKQASKITRAQSVSIWLNKGTLNQLFRVKEQIIKVH